MIQEPSIDKAIVVPDVIFVPMLAFNEKCERLGYGGGYYDRTICQLKYEQNRLLLTIGLAFETQKFKHLDGEEEIF